MPQQIIYEKTDIALMCRSLFGVHILHNKGILLYSELTERENGTTIIDAAKNSLEEGYLDFLLLFKEDKPGRISDKDSFINALDAVYYMDSIENRDLLKYIPGEDNITELMDKYNLEKIHTFTEGELAPETITDDEIEIPAYILIVPAIAIRG